MIQVQKQRCVVVSTSTATLDLVARLLCARHGWTVARCAAGGSPFAEVKPYNRGETKVLNGLLSHYQDGAMSAALTASA